MAIPSENSLVCDYTEHIQKKHVPAKAGMYAVFRFENATNIKTRAHTHSRRIDVLERLHQDRHVGRHFPAIRL